MGFQVKKPESWVLFRCRELKNSGFGYVVLYNASCFISFIFVFIPPGAEKPPSWPSDLIILWHGIISSSWFFASVFAAGRAAFGEPAIFANWVYDIFWPKGTFRQLFRMFFWKGVKSFRSRGMVGSKFTGWPLK